MRRWAMLGFFAAAACGGKSNVTAEAFDAGQEGGSSDVDASVDVAQEDRGASDAAPDRAKGDDADASTDTTSADVTVEEPPESDGADEPPEDAAAEPDARAFRDAPLGWLDGDASTELDFVPVSDRVDMVHDAKRGRLYVSTKSGAVVEYGLAEHAVVGKFDLGGSLQGIDLSPNQDTLVVADQTVDADHSWIHVVDLTLGTNTTITFPVASLESGTFTAVFVDDDTALVTSSYAGSGYVPFRRVTLHDGTSTEVRNVTQDTMLAPSADRSVVSVAESNTSNGPAGRYRVADGDFAEIETDRFLYEIAVSRSGDQYALPAHDGLFIYDGNFKKNGSLGNTDKWAAGAVYSPASDRLYVAWSYSGAAMMGPAIEAFDSELLQPIGVVEANRPIAESGNHAFVAGRLRISRDGALLFATVDGGVAIYGVPP